MAQTDWDHENLFQSSSSRPFLYVVVVVVALLFYVHVKHLRSVNLSTLFLGRL